MQIDPTKLPLLFIKTDLPNAMRCNFTSSGCTRHYFIVTKKTFAKSRKNNQSKIKAKVLKRIHIFYTSDTFIRNARLKLAKNQAKAQQDTEVELLIFENYWLSSSILSSKINRRPSKKCTKNK